MVIRKSLALSLLVMLISSVTIINIEPAFTQSFEIANVRGKDFRNITYANGTHIATFGLEEWLPSQTGYVPYIMTDGGTTWNVDMKQFPFKIDKTDCGVTVYNNDKPLNNNPEVLIEKEWWNVGWKPTTGGTWTEVNLSNTACSINTINNSTGLYIETTKTVGGGQGIGTLTVTYAKAIGEPFKTYQKFTNTDATKANHIFKFIEKYDNIHLDSISTQLGKTTQDGTLTISFSDITQSQLMSIEKSGYNIFNLDITKAFNNFQSVTFTKTGGLADASFDYGRNLITLPVGSSQSLDPTFGYVTGSKVLVTSTAGANTSCLSPYNKNTAFNILRKANSTDTGTTCQIISMYWDISQIPDDATITDTTIRYDVTVVLNPINCDFNQITNYPPTASASTLWDDITNTGGGTTYVNNDSECTIDSDNKILDLGTSADSDLSSQLTVNWFAIGVPFDNMVRDSIEHRQTFGIFSGLAIELQVTYTGGTLPTGVYAANASQVTTTCPTRTTSVTLATIFPAGDNIIIAPVHVVSTDAGTETVDIRLYKSTTLLAQNEFLTQVGTSGKGNSYTLLYKDTGAAASPTYTVEVCFDVSAVDAQAKILAINGFTSTDFIDGSSTALGTGDTTLATKTTSFPAGNNVVLAMVTVDNGGTAQDIVAAGIRVKNNGGTEIASNQFAMSFGTAAATDIQNIFLVAKDDSAPANAAYTVTGKSPNAANGEAKLLIFQPKSYAYVNGGSVGIGTTETELASISTSFPAFTDLAIVAGNEFDDSDAAVETISIGAFDLLSHSTAPTVNTYNQYAIEAFAASGSAGDGFRYGIISKVSTEIANPAPETDATASATGLNGESKIVAFEIANPISQVNCDACNPSPQPNVGCCIFVLAQLAQNYMKEPERIDR